MKLVLKLITILMACICNLVYSSNNNYVNLEVGQKFIYHFNDDKYGFQDEVSKVVQVDSIVRFGKKVAVESFYIKRIQDIKIDSSISYSFFNNNTDGQLYSVWVKSVNNIATNLIDNIRYTKGNMEYDIFHDLHDNVKSLTAIDFDDKLDIVKNIDWANNSKKFPIFKMIGIPGLGIVQMRYQKSSSDTTEWRNPCTDQAYRAELQAKSPGIEVMPCVLDTLPASAENPYHQSYYLRYIIGASGDTTFDYHRDIIKWAPSLATLKPQNPNIPQNVAGTWILPVGFEVQKVERILANGSTEKLSYQIQNQKLFLSEIKNRNAVEWVRIVPKNGVARTLRWE